MKRHVPTDGEKPGAGAAALTEDADGRKRARRLLGRALLGTLQKFRQEDAQFQVRLTVGTIPGLPIWVANGYGWTIRLTGGVTLYVS